MAKKQYRYPAVNFIPKDPFYDTPIGKGMVWALRVGRYIVVFTEIIVIMSFASRFKLDRDLTDINSSIVQKTALIQSYGSTETQVRLIQTRSQKISDLLSQNAPLSQLNVLIGEVPTDVKLSRIGYQATEIQIGGVAQSSASFASFLQTLQHTPSFKGVIIDQLETGDKRDPGYVFAIRIELTDQPTSSTAPLPVAPSTTNTTDATLSTGK
ncbi:hypothetical protein C5B42_02240 [Candidatus Cerribacteria bacterium 'Amazon FNV 2010 28 9']|uniref:Fimbrial assembly protein n=1 Tax=Candidatus Cerribacteria bacterium 'Amazon FNV 2010 28 9' TaxID=2081795 RepID=A0A317JP62_9BACT|nr:MAG: hypothetical protein C5B42_02240 [Candidatus Cerribacteria bacterium 'Amazon FNV 2010 28 9']